MPSSPEVMIWPPAEASVAYWTAAPASGAQPTHGAIRARWGSLGWETSALAPGDAVEVLAPTAGG